MDDKIKKSVLIYLKELMIKNKTWKETTNARRPERDKKYKRTQEVIEMLKKYK